VLEADEALANWLAELVTGPVHYRQAPLNTKPPYYEYWVTNETPWVGRGFGDDSREVTYTICAASLNSVDAAQRFAVISRALETGEDSGKPKVPGWHINKSWSWGGRYNDDMDMLPDGDPVYREGAMYEVVLTRRT